MSITLKLVALTAPFVAPLVHRWLDLLGVLVDEGVLCPHAGEPGRCEDCERYSEMIRSTIRPIDAKKVLDDLEESWTR